MSSSEESGLTSLETLLLCFSPSGPCGVAEKVPNEVLPIPIIYGKSSSFDGPACPASSRHHSLVEVPSDSSVRKLVDRSTISDVGYVSAYKMSGDKEGNNKLPFAKDIGPKHCAWRSPLAGLEDSLVRELDVQQFPADHGGDPSQFMIPSSHGVYAPKSLPLSKPGNGSTGLSEKQSKAQQDGLANDDGQFFARESHGHVVRVPQVVADMVPVSEYCAIHDVNVIAPVNVMHVYPGYGGPLGKSPEPVRKTEATQGCAAAVVLEASRLSRTASAPPPGAAVLLPYSASGQLRKGLQDKLQKAAEELLVKERAGEELEVRSMLRDPECGPRSTAAVAVHLMHQKMVRLASGGGNGVGRPLPLAPICPGPYPQGSRSLKGASPPLGTYNPPTRQLVAETHELFRYDPPDQSRTIPHHHQETCMHHAEGGCGSDDAVYDVLSEYPIYPEAVHALPVGHSSDYFGVPTRMTVSDVVVPQERKGEKAIVEGMGYGMHGNVYVVSRDTSQSSVGSGGCADVMDLRKNSSCNTISYRHNADLSVHGPGLAARNVGAPLGNSSHTTLTPPLPFGAGDDFYRRQQQPYGFPVTNVALSAVAPCDVMYPGGSGCQGSQHPLTAQHAMSMPAGLELTSSTGSFSDLPYMTLSASASSKDYCLDYGDSQINSKGNSTNPALCHEAFMRSPFISPNEYPFGFEPAQHATKISDDNMLDDSVAKAGNGYDVNAAGSGIISNAMVVSAAYAKSMMKAITTYNGYSTGGGNGVNDNVDVRQQFGSVGAECVATSLCDQGLGLHQLLVPAPSVHISDVLASQTNFLPSDTKVTGTFMPPTKFAVADDEITIISHERQQSVNEQNRNGPPSWLHNNDKKDGSPLIPLLPLQQDPGKADGAFTATQQGSSGRICLESTMVCGQDTNNNDHLLSVVGHDKLTEDSDSASPLLHTAPDLEALPSGFEFLYFSDDDIMLFTGLSAVEVADAAFQVDLSPIPRNSLSTGCTQHPSSPQSARTMELPRAAGRYVLASPSMAVARDPTMPLGGEELTGMISPFAVALIEQETVTDDIVRDVQGESHVSLLDEQTLVASQSSLVVAPRVTDLFGAWDDPLLQMPFDFFAAELDKPMIYEERRAELEFDPVCFGVGGQVQDLTHLAQPFSLMDRRLDQARMMSGKRTPLINCSEIGSVGFPNQLEVMWPPKEGLPVYSARSYSGQVAPSHQHCPQLLNTCDHLQDENKLPLIFIDEVYVGGEGAPSSFIGQQEGMFSVTNSIQEQENENGNGQHPSANWATTQPYANDLPRRHDFPSMATNGAATPYPATVPYPSSFIGASQVALHDRPASAQTLGGTRFAHTQQKQQLDSVPAPAKPIPMAPRVAQGPVRRLTTPLRTSGVTLRHLSSLSPIAAMKKNDVVIRAVAGHIPSPSPGGAGNDLLHRPQPEGTSDMSTNTNDDTLTAPGEGCMDAPLHSSKDPNAPSARRDRPGFRCLNSVLTPGQATLSAGVATVAGSRVATRPAPAAPATPAGPAFSFSAGITVGRLAPGVLSRSPDPINKIRFGEMGVMAFTAWGAEKAPSAVAPVRVPHAAPYPLRKVGSPSAPQESEQRKRKTVMPRTSNVAKHGKLEDRAVNFASAAGRQGQDLKSNLAASAKDKAPRLHGSGSILPDLDLDIALWDLNFQNLNHHLIELDPNASFWGSHGDLVDDSLVDEALQLGIADDLAAAFQDDDYDYGVFSPEEEDEELEQEDSDEELGPAGDENVVEIRPHKGSSRRQLTKSALEKVYHLPIHEAAAHLNIGVTVLKKYCRKFSIPRWPYRKLKSIDKLKSSLDELLARGGHFGASGARCVLEQIQRMRQKIYRNPEIDIDEEVKRVRQANFKMEYKARQQGGFVRKRRTSTSILDHHHHSGLTKLHRALGDASAKFSGAQVRFA